MLYLGKKTKTQGSNPNEEKLDEFPRSAHPLSHKFEELLPISSSSDGVSHLLVNESENCFSGWTRLLC